MYSILCTNPIGIVVSWHSVIVRWRRMVVGWWTIPWIPASLTIYMNETKIVFDLVISILSILNSALEFYNENHNTQNCVEHFYSPRMIAPMRAANKIAFIADIFVLICLCTLGENRCLLFTRRVFCNDKCQSSEVFYI